MEKGREITPEEAEKYFNLDLIKSPEDVRNRYSSLLLREQLDLAKKNNGRPMRVSLETRERFLHVAKNTQNDEEARRVIKMEKDWNAATSKDGRPPIGGATDD